MSDNGFTRFPNWLIDMNQKKMCIDCGGVIRGSGRKRCHSCNMANYKALEKGYSGQSRLKKRIVGKRGNRCEDCGASGNGSIIHLHHTIPVKDGGKTNEENCVLLCFNCHKTRHGGSFSR